MQHYTHAQLPGLVGQDLAVSDWLTITQQRIDTFADATDDHQWIHVDAARAQAGPFGRTIAHGYLTLSLVAGLGQRSLAIDDEAMSINYGLDKVRFPSPVREGSRVRARFTLQRCAPIEGGPNGRGGLELGIQVTIEIDGGDKPACVAQAIRRTYR